MGSKPKITEQQADELLQFYFHLIHKSAETDDLHEFAWFAQWIDEAAELISEYLKELEEWK